MHYCIIKQPTSGVRMPPELLSGCFRIRRPDKPEYAAVLLRSDSISGRLVFRGGIIWEQSGIDTVK
jgi:hypothetical protein